MVHALDWTLLNGAIACLLGLFECCLFLVADALSHTHTLLHHHHHHHHIGGRASLFSRNHHVILSRISYYFLSAHPVHSFNNNNTRASPLPVNGLINPPGACFVSASRATDWCAYTSTLSTSRHSIPRAEREGRLGESYHLHTLIPF